jgi:hypothetical protein
MRQGRGKTVVLIAFPSWESSVSQDLTDLPAILTLVKSKWELLIKNEAILGVPTLFVLRFPFGKVLPVKI